MHSRGKAQTKIASEYGRVMTNRATVAACPSRMTSAWPKSTWASPGGWASGTKTSADRSLPGGDGLLDDGQAALVAVLVAEPLEDPAGGVPLLPGGLLVGLEDLVDDGQEGVELGPGPGGRAAVSGRLGVVEDLLERVPVDVELAADGAFALAVDEDATADLGPVLHVGVHP